MKKKIILSSVLAIVLCVSLIAGSTFALFTSVADINIAVNAGNVEVKATASEVTLSSDLGETLPETAASVEGSVVTLANMVPGDKAEFTITVSNLSNVSAKYRTVIKCEENTGLLDALTITVGDKTFIGETIKTSWADLEVGCEDQTVNVVIEFPNTDNTISNENADNQYQNTGCKLSYTVEAVQGNAGVVDPVTYDTENDIYYINDEYGMLQMSDIISSDAEAHIVLNADMDMSEYDWTPIDNFKGTFDGNSKTISNLTVSASTYAGLFGYLAAGFGGEDSATIQNVTIDGANVTAIHNEENDAYAGALVGYHFSKGGNITISNVAVTNSTLTGKNVGAISGTLSMGNVSGCTSEGNTINGSRIGGILGSLLEGGSVIGSAVSENDLNVCNLTDESAVYVGTIVGRVTGGTVENNETTIEKVVTVEATEGKTANDALDEAIAAGETTFIIPEGTYVLTNNAQGKELTIIGSGAPEDTVVATNTGGSYEGCNYALDGSNVLFENITITTDGNTFTGYARCNATYNNCIINNTYFLYGTSVFNNCTFNVSGNAYNIWTYGSPSAEFNNCTFNCDGKAIYADGNGNTGTKVTLNDCVFNDRTNGVGGYAKAAVETGTTYGKTYELIINNTTVNGFAVNPDGIVTNSTVWANKHSMGTDKLNVVIDGVDVY